MHTDMTPTIEIHPCVDYHEGLTRPADEGETPDFWSIYAAAAASPDGMVVVGGRAGPRPLMVRAAGNTDRRH